MITFKMLATLVCLVALTGALAKGLTEDEKDLLGAKYERLLVAFDLDKDGYLTKEELRLGGLLVCSLSSTNKTDPECTQTRKDFATWANVLLSGGKLSLEQVKEKLLEIVSVFPDAFWAQNVITFTDAFDTADSHDDDVLSPQEFRELYRVFGYGEGYDIDALFRSVDVDKDGLVSRDEYAIAGATYWSKPQGYENLFYPEKEQSNGPG